MYIEMLMSMTKAMHLTITPFSARATPSARETRASSQLMTTTKKEKAHHIHIALRD